MRCAHDNCDVGGTNDIDGSNLCNHFHVVAVTGTNMDLTTPEWIGALAVVGGMAANAVLFIDRWLHDRTTKEDELNSSINGGPSVRMEIDYLKKYTNDRFVELRLDMDRLHADASKHGSEQQVAVGKIEDRIHEIDTRFQVFQGRTNEKIRSLFVLIGQRHEDYDTRPNNSNEK